MNRKIVGRVLIFLGISMWIPYLVLEVLGTEVSVTPFLAAHLSGVIPGAILLRGETLVRWLARRLNRHDVAERVDTTPSTHRGSTKKN